MAKNTPDFETHSFIFPASMEHEFDKQIRKIERKAKGVGSLIEFEVTDDMVRLTDLPSGGILKDEFYAKRKKERDLYGKVLDNTPDPLIAVKKVTIRVPDPEFKLPGGWKYIGTLDRKEGGLMIHGDLDFDTYDEAEFRCDHCNTNRLRHSVHVFEDNKGYEKMIATSCAKKYFGEDVGRLVNKMWGFLNWLPDFDGMGSDDPDRMYGGFGGDYFKCDRLITLSYGILNARGGYTKAQDNYGEYNSDSTKMWIERMDSWINGTVVRKWDRTELEVFEEAKEIIKNIPDNFVDNMKQYWFDNRKAGSFQNNIHVAINGSGKYSGLIAYGVHQFMDDTMDYTGRHKAREEMQDSIVNEYFAEKGEKFGYKAKGSNPPVKCRVMYKPMAKDSWDFGTYYITKLITESGHILTSIGSWIGDKDKELNLRFRIKDTNEYKGKKSCLITMVKEVN